MAKTDYSAYYTWITLGEYLMKVLALTFVEAIFIFSLLQLFSAMLRNRFLIYGASIAVITVLFALLLFFPQHAGFNPISYLNVKGVVTGEMGVRFGYLGIEYFKGLFVLVCSSIFLYFLGRQLSAKAKI